MAKMPKRRKWRLIEKTLTKIEHKMRKNREKVTQI